MYSFDVLISKIKKYKKIFILIYFQLKNTLHCNTKYIFYDFKALSRQLRLENYIYIYIERERESGGVYIKFVLYKNPLDMSRKTSRWS